MRDTFLPYGHQWIDDDDVATVVEALKADKITTGEKVDEFERAVATYCGAKYGVAVSSGTAALHATCAVAGITDGDEVITTPITFFATVAAAVFCGGTPVLADVRRDTVNIDPFEVIESISSDKTKAIIPVDFAGHPVDLDEIISIAESFDLVVIEDACHALGAEYKGRKVGSISDMTVFSFHPVKSITTGEGGMVLTNNEDYYNRLRMFRNHNIRHSTEHWKYDIQSVGYNCRLTDFQCALGLSQLSKLDWFIARRREIARVYNQAFAGVEGITIPVELDYAKSSHHLYIIRVTGDNRDKFITELVKENIGTQVHYIPVHYMSAFARYGYKKGDFPIAESYSEHAVSLPIFPKMSDEDVADVIIAVRKVMKIL